MTTANYPKHNNNQDNSWMGKVYLISGILMLLGMIWAFSSCSVVREVVKTEVVVERHDSISWRDSIIRYQIPLEKNQAITEVGDTSRLETSLAESLAWVDSVGRLHHTLEHRKGTIDIPVAIPSRTIWVNTTKKTEQIREKIVEVKKSLSWWQNFRIRSFWWLVAAVFVFVLYIFRKPILKLISHGTLG